MLNQGERRSALSLFLEVRMEGTLTLTLSLTRTRTLARTLTPTLTSTRWRSYACGRRWGWHAWRCSGARRSFAQP